MFPFVGQRILDYPLLVGYLALPNLLNYVVMISWSFPLGYFLGWKYESVIDVVLIGSSSHFEVAIAVAVTLYGIGSAAALATVIGPMFEVPLMLAVFNLGFSLANISIERKKYKKANQNKRGKILNINKTLGIIIITVIVAIGLSAAFFLRSSPFPSQQLARELDFTVSGSSDCLRFLNSTVSTIYVPFTTAANENWQLTINCSKMSGGINGYTDVYIYDGFWDEGSNYKCVSSDLYPILSEIKSTDHQIRLNSSFTETYGGSTQQSYTVFFVVPPGGQQTTFHITYKEM